MLRRLCGRVDPEATETRSNPEIDFLALCREAGLPMPAVNALVEGRMVDFSWPRARLVVEVDTYRFHGDRTAFERDHESTMVLRRAGYEVLRTTDRMLEGDAARTFLGLVSELLSSRV